MYFSSQSPSLAEIITCPCFFTLPLDVLTGSYHGLSLPYQAEDKLILPIFTSSPFPKCPCSTSQLSPWESTLFYSSLRSPMQSIFPKWHHIGAVIKKKLICSFLARCNQPYSSATLRWRCESLISLVLLHFTGLDSAGKLPISCDQRQGICFSPELIGLLYSQEGGPSLLHPQASQVTMMRAEKPPWLAHCLLWRVLKLAEDQPW